MMRVLLANPPWRKGEGRYGVRAGSRWPFTVPAAGPKDLKYLPFPFFMAQAAAVLEKAEAAEVLALDAIAEGLTEEEYFRRVEDFRPDLLLAETAAASFAEDLRLAGEARRRLPGLRIALAGPHATIHPEAILARHPEADFCLIGEYELTLLDLVRGLSGPGFDPGRTPGLAWRAASGSPVVNPRREPPDMARLPWPSHRHFPMTAYRDPFCGAPMPMVNMLASRGCPYRCSFCLWPETVYGSRAYRPRPVDDVAAEMEFLVRTYGFRTVYFDDDTFNIGKPRMLALAGAVRERNLGVALAAMARADAWDEETVEAFRRAGLFAVKYGVESADQAILDRCGKSLDLDRVRRMVRFTREIGVRVHLTFTLGLPGETADSLARTRDLALELDPDSLQISLATPFPGTRFHREARVAGHLLASDEVLYDGGHGCVVRTESLGPEQIEAGLAEFSAAWKRRLAEREVRP